MQQQILLNPHLSFCDGLHLQKWLPGRNEEANGKTQVCSSFPGRLGLVPPLRLGKSLRVNAFNEFLEAKTRVPAILVLPAMANCG